MEILLLQHKDTNKENITSVILCAGEGTRVRDIAIHIPKPLIKIKFLNNQTILSHLISSLINLEIEPIVVVTGHLGEQIEDFVNSFQIKNKYKKNKILVNRSGVRYKLGPLHSFLSITENNQIYKENRVFMIFPGDTIFDYNLLQEILNLILKNYSLLENYSIVFYRKIKISSLKEKFKTYDPNLFKTISYLKINRNGSKSYVREIKQRTISSFTNKKTIHQVIPIFIFSFRIVQEIKNLANCNRFKTIREIVNLIIKKEEIFLALSIDPEYDFYDIDSPIDLTILNEKKKDGQ